ncbi:MAG TPA: dihydrolipoamide acetyltransferase family protein [Longimicrobiales bacterium]
MSEYRMPSLGADMKDGLLVEWYVQPGSALHRGQVIALVDTHKGAIEIEVFEDGVLEEILVPPGERVPVGAVMARIASGTDAAVAASAPAAAAAERATSAAPTAEPAAPPVAAGPPAPAAPAPAPAGGPSFREPPILRGSGPGGAVTIDDVRAARATRPDGAAPVEPVRESRPRASPVARRIAETLGIDLGTVRGTGARGTIVRADVERAAGERRAVPPQTPPASAAAPPPEPAGAAAPAFTSSMREAIAAAVSRSAREIPHYFLATDVSMARALAWLARINEGRPSSELLLPAALQIRAVALALREFPDFNGFWIDGALRPAAGVHVGIAVSLRGGGLVVPAIHDADRMQPDELMHALSDVVSRARTGRLRGSEVADGTITVTSVGERGVETVFGIIYPPQVALIGFGRITERPWAEGGMVGARPVVTITLAADHRASDGHRGGLFLSAIARRLSEPEAP